jgi:hypothetical protein
MEEPSYKKLFITLGVSILVILVLKSLLMKSATNTGAVYKQRKEAAERAKAPPPAPVQPVVQPAPPPPVQAVEPQPALQPVETQPAPLPLATPSTIAASAVY